MFRLMFSMRSLFRVHMLRVVDANNAGSGELSIVVNNGSVPSSARMISQNVYAVSFMPYEPGIHTVELYFNCVPLKGLVFPLTAKIDELLVFLYTFYNE